MTHRHPGPDRTRAPFLACLALLTLAGPTQPARAEEHREDEGHQDIVHLSPAEIQEFNIQVTAAGPGEIRTIRKLPGEVKVNGNRLAHILPRYNGIVTDVRANIGDVVRRGQVLAVIESDESLAPYEMKTILGGTVLNRHLTPGEAVSRDRGGFEVADLSNVWVDITVYQRDLDQVKVGQEVTVQAGSRDRTVTGTLSYVTPTLNAHTRTATARLVIDNPDGCWRPGMFVTAQVLTGHFPAAVVVPTGAVLTFEERNVVFVETPAGFVPRPVDLGRGDDRQHEIVSGLAPGERYVTTGGFTLKAELGKGSFGTGHNH